jgi:DNA-binding CsgD family transcriptional regulator/PAS domain-containing protein
MADALLEDTTDAVYRAALEPLAWNDVMQLMGRRFPSLAQTFYLLHMTPRRIQPVALSGIAPSWVRSFDALYFAPDNPWIRMTQHLHKPGVIRTNERLDRVLRRRGALYRSSYFNEWMRPQGFKFTIGNTLLAEGGVVANITLMRQPDMPTFSGTEVRAFEVLSRHMTRALRMAIQLDRLESHPAGIAMLDALPQAIAIVDAGRRVLHANPAMVDLLVRRRGLVLRDGLLTAADAAACVHVETLITRTLMRPGAQTGDGRLDLPLPVLGSAPLRLQAIPLKGQLDRGLAVRPTVLLVATEPAVPLRSSIDDRCRQRGCTPAESRLVALLAQGQPLRQCAEAMGLTYGSARIYLKAVFDKFDVHSQAQLVAHVLTDAQARP